MTEGSTVTDAVPNNTDFNEFFPNIQGQEVCGKLFDQILNSFTHEDCKSFLFLLMDKLDGVDNFISLSKAEKWIIIDKIKRMELIEDVLIELLGTLKMYKALTLFKTCSHIFQVKDQSFQNVRRIWKMFYALCEEITEWELRKMLIFIPEIYRNQINSAEEWFAFALKCNIISETDISRLRGIFQDNHTCLSVINDFECPKLQSYTIRQSTQDSDCGIALILNFETFQSSQHLSAENQLPSRTGSDKDVGTSYKSISCLPLNRILMVIIRLRRTQIFDNFLGGDSLSKLWYTFGFQTIVWKDLSKGETLSSIKNFALEDHSRYDVFVCCVLSHGNANVFYASDGQEIQLKKFIATFCKIPSLLNKPKLFFIQACQGKNILLDDQKGVYNYDNDHQKLTSDLSSSASEMDIMAVVASINGFVSFRHTQAGSLFVQSLCKIMKKYGANSSMLDLITQVTNDVTNQKIPLGEGKLSAIQIPPTYNTLRKTLILKKRECILK